MKKRLFQLSLLLSASSALASYSVNLAPGYNLIAYQVNYNGPNLGGNTLYNVFENDVLSGLWDGSQILMDTTNCAGYKVYVADSGSPTLWSDPAGNPIGSQTTYVSPTAGVSSSAVRAGRGMLMNNQSGSTIVWNVSGNPVTPSFPLSLNCPCGSKYLLCRQDEGAGTYNNITGLSPVEGSQVFTTISGPPDNIFSAGAWTPSVPNVLVGHSVFIIPTPCYSNNCLFVQCSNIVVTSCTNLQVFYSPTVTEVCSNNTVNGVVCTPSSGSFFAPGTTTPVHCLAVDSGGNAATCDFTVTVLCPQPLSLNCPTNVLICTGTNGQCGLMPNMASYVTALSSCPPVTLSQDVAVGSTVCASSAPFGVTITATDACSNSVSCFVPFVFGPCPCVPPPAGMSAWWPFDETAGSIARDLAGAVNNAGSYIGPTPAPGAVSNALCFNGASDFAQVPNQAEVNFRFYCTNGAESFTIDSWIKANPGGPVTEMIVDKRVGASPSPVQGYTVFLNNGSLAFQMADGTFQNYFSSSPDLRDGTWHFIAVTVARCGTNGNVGTFYVDGAILATFLDPRTGTLDNTAPLQIGRPTPGFSGGYFFGCIDELEFFKRTLSPSEIQAIYHAGAGGKCKCNSALTLSCVPAKTVNCTNSWSFDQPTATDISCSNQVVVAVVSTVTNSSPCPLVVTRTWRATGCCSNLAFCSQTVTVVDTNPPVIVCVPDKTVVCPTNWSFNAPTATDACCTNAQISIVSTVTNSGPCPLVVIRTWKATGCCTNVAFCSQKVTVVDTNPPVITCATNMTMNCTNWFFNVPTAVDACCSNVTIATLFTITNSGPCPHSYTRFWKATDCCSNTAVCSQTVTLVDTTPPVITCGTNKTVNCTTNWAFSTPTAIDQCCGTNVTITLLSRVTNSTSPLIITQTWKATDASGNFSTCSQTITVLNNPPINDPCIPLLPVGVGTYCGSTRCATPSAFGTLLPAFHTAHLLSQQSRDVWYKFTPTCSGYVLIHTCGSTPALCPSLVPFVPFHTILSVYQGTCGALTMVPGAWNYNYNCQTPHQAVVPTFYANANVPLYIRVAGVGPGQGASEFGEFRLTIAQYPSSPVNDKCFAPTVIGNGTFPWNNCGADTDGPNNAFPCGTVHDVWFNYTPPCGGQVWIDTCGSSVDTVLSVYTGPCTSLAMVANGCNNDSTDGRCISSAQSFVSFTATANVTYHIRVGSSSANPAVGGGLLTVNGPYPNLGTCPPASGPCYWRYFWVLGTANNTPWSWSIGAPCCVNIGTNVPGVTNGASAFVLAQKFVASINSACPPAGSGGVVAQTFGTAGIFGVCVKSCTNTPTPWVFRVGPSGAPPEQQCVVLGYALYTTGPCSFNPDMAELPTSNTDYNDNGVDDAIDILFGTSLDLNENGIPDEAEACVAPVLTDQPVSQTVQLGTAITLSATVGGTGPFTYRWTLGGVPLSDSANISGSGSSTLTIQSIANTNLGDYALTISNACGGTATAPVTLAVQTAPVVQIVIPTYDSGTFQFSFETVLGQNYLIEYSEDLIIGEWTPLMSVEGDGSVRQVSDPWPTAATRFYRVRKVGP